MTRENNERNRNRGNTLEPFNPSTTYGIELEMHIPSDKINWDRIAEMKREQGVDSLAQIDEKPINFELPSGWQTVRDGSITAYDDQKIMQAPSSNPVDAKYVNGRNFEQYCKESFDLVDKDKDFTHEEAERDITDIFRRYIGETPGRTDLEVVSPVMKTDKDIRAISQVTDKLKAEGAETNITTGLHVHVGILTDEKGSPTSNSDLLEKDLNPKLELLKQMAITYKAYEEEGLEFPKRRYYMESIKNRGIEDDDIKGAKDIEELKEVVGTGKKSPLNFDTLMVHGTLEIRPHEGSLDDRKNRSWISTINDVVDISKQTLEKNNGHAESLSDESLEKVQKSVKDLCIIL